MSELIQSAEHIKAVKRSKAGMMRQRSRRVPLNIPAHPRRHPEVGGWPDVDSPSKRARYGIIKSA